MKDKHTPEPSVRSTLERAAAVIENSRLELPDEPDKVWLHGYTVAKDAAVSMLRSLASNPAALSLSPAQPATEQEPSLNCPECDAMPGSRQGELDQWLT